MTDDAVTAQSWLEDANSMEIDKFLALRDFLVTRFGSGKKNVLKPVKILPTLPNSPISQTLSKGS